MVFVSTIRQNAAVWGFFTPNFMIVYLGIPLNTNVVTRRTRAAAAAATDQNSLRYLKKTVQDTNCLAFARTRLHMLAHSRTRWHSLQLARFLYRLLVRLLIVQKDNGCSYQKT